VFNAITVCAVPPAVIVPPLSVGVTAADDAKRGTSAKTLAQSTREITFMIAAPAYLIARKCRGLRVLLKTHLTNFFLILTERSCAT